MTNKSKVGAAATEFLKQRERLKFNFHEGMRKLDRDFAFANNPYRKGDKVSDNTHAIIIEDIKFSRFMEPVPCCVYYGKWLTKAGEPNKKGEVVAIWQNAVTFHESASKKERSKTP